MYYVLCNHSSSCGHLNCFHTLAIVKDTAMNMRVNMALWDKSVVFFVYVPRSVGLYDSSIFNFLRKLPTAFYWALQVHIVPPRVLKCSLFFLSSLKFVISHLFDRCPNRYKVMSHGVFDFHFQVISGV